MGRPTEGGTAVSLKNGSVIPMKISIKKKEVIQT